MSLPSAVWFDTVGWVPSDLLLMSVLLIPFSFILEQTIQLTRVHLDRDGGHGCMLKPVHSVEFYSHRMHCIAVRCGRHNTTCHTMPRHNAPHHATPQSSGVNTANGFWVWLVQHMPQCNTLHSVWTKLKSGRSVIITHAGCTAIGEGIAFSRVCLFVCRFVHTKRKTAWAINTKLGTRILYSSRLACVVPEVKRSKFKVIWLRKPSWSHGF